MDIRVEPGFLQGSSGRLHVVQFMPAHPTSAVHGVVFFPPFAEELNKSRRMMNLAARQLAARGCSATLVDLFGCGDSEGDFSDASWETWVDDMVQVFLWMRARNVRLLGSVAVRAGALLETDVALRVPGLIQRSVWWQPVADGRRHLDQFLRLRMIADLEQTGERLDTRALRRLLDAGETVEVAGYALTPNLAASLDHRRLDSETGARAGTRVHWFEVKSALVAEPSPAVISLTEKLHAGGCAVISKVFVGKQFWSTPEITVIQALVEETAEAFCSAS